MVISRKSINVRNIPVDLWDRFGKAAAESGVTISGLLAVIVSKWLSDRDVRRRERITDALNGVE